MTINRTKNPFSNSFSSAPRRLERTTGDHHSRNMPHVNFCSLLVRRCLTFCRETSSCLLMNSGILSSSRILCLVGSLGGRVHELIRGRMCACNDQNVVPHLRNVIVGQVVQCVHPQTLGDVVGEGDLSGESLPASKVRASDIGCSSRLVGSCTCANVFRLVGAKCRRSKYYGSG